MTGVDVSLSGSQFGRVRVGQPGRAAESISCSIVTTVKMLPVEVLGQLIHHGLGHPLRNAGLPYQHFYGPIPRRSRWAQSSSARCASLCAGVPCFASFAELVPGQSSLAPPILV